MIPLDKPLTIEKPRRFKRGFFLGGGSSEDLDEGHGHKHPLDFGMA